MHHRCRTLHTLHNFYLAPCTLHLAPCTLHLAPCTLHFLNLHFFHLALFSPCTFRPCTFAPCTLHLAPCTLHFFKLGTNWENFTFHLHVFNLHLAPCADSCTVLESNVFCGLSHNFVFCFLHFCITYP